MTHNCAYVRQHYQVPDEIDRRVITYGKPGVIWPIAAITSALCWMKTRRSASATTIPPHEMQYSEMAESPPL
jgi:hypothetical protein